MMEKKNFANYSYVPHFQIGNEQSTRPVETLFVFVRKKLIFPDKYKSQNGLIVYWATKYFA